jgi:hypothetical protein
MDHPGKVDVRSKSPGDQNIANGDADFFFIFNRAVGSQDRSPEQDSCYKFRDGVIGLFAALRS